MAGKKFSEKRVCEILLGILVWFALGLQLGVIIKNAPATGLSYTSEIVRYFSYMTILSNILVALVFTFQVINTGGFFQRASVQAAVFVYIFIVGLLNHLLLSHLSTFTGLQLLCDRLLHYVVPIVYVLYWFIFATKRKVAYGDIIWWLIFPLVYVIYSMVRGSVVGWYPYPFLNALEHGYPFVFKMMGIITVAYAVTSLLLVFINNKITSRH